MFFGDQPDGIGGKEDFISVLHIAGDAGSPVFRQFDVLVCVAVSVLNLQVARHHVKENRLSVGIVFDAFFVGLVSIKNAAAVG